MKAWPFVVALTMLGGAGLVLSSRSRAEPPLAREPFRSFPLTLEGGWIGRDLPLDKDVLALLNLSDYLNRVYRHLPAAGEPLGVSAAQSGAPVWLYVGFYRSQRTGATYHSPKNCLPGSGWHVGSSREARGVIPRAPEASVNRVVIARGSDRQMILYWYQDRGRIVASEYTAKAYLIWDAATRNRTDGALVRISTPIEGTEEEAYAYVLAFLRALWNPLTPHLPV